jgi:hypothetical protein
MFHPKKKKTQDSLRNEESHVLGCDGIWLLLGLIFQRNISPPSSGWKESEMMEVIIPYEMSVLSRATWCHIPEDGIIHSHCLGDLISYTASEMWYIK